MTLLLTASVLRMSLYIHEVSNIYFLKFILSCLLSTMQQYQNLKFNPFIIRHCTHVSAYSSISSALNLGKLLCLPRYCDRCFRVYNVSKLRKYSSSSYAICIVFLVCLLHIECAVCILSQQRT
jgi:hypothetical protein